MSELKKGLVWSGYSQIIQTVLQLLAVFVLARLLTPDDFGILSIVAIFIAIGNMMVDSGMGGALLRMKNPSSIDFSTLFVFNIVVSLLLYAVFFAGAGYLANYYQQPVLKELLRVLSLSVVFNAMGIVQYVKLVIDLRFKELAIITFASTILSVLLSVVSAVAGAGIWALVVQQLSFSFFYNLMIALKIKYIPVLHFSRNSFREQKSFGLSVLGANLLNTLSENLNNNIVAKIVPIHQAGHFYQSNRLILTADAGVRSVFDKVLFPVFAKVSDPEDLKNSFLDVFKKVVAVVFPLSVLLSLGSDAVVLILLGPQWSEAGWIFQVLSLTLVPLILITISRNVFKASGHTKSILHLEIVRSVLLIGLLFTTASLGLPFLVWGILVGLLIVSVVNLAVVSSRLKIEFIYFVKLLGIIMLPSALAFGATLVMATLFTIGNVLLMFLLKSLIFVVLLIAFSKLLRQYELVELVKVFIKKA